MRNAVLILAAVSFLGIACDDSTAPPVPADISAAVALQPGVPAGALVPEPPAVRVVARSGKPVPGVRVEFVVRAGGGHVDGAVAQTGRDGIARAGSWVVGAAPGFNIVAATAAGVDAEIVFEVVGLPPNCPGLVDLTFQPGGFRRFTHEADAGVPCMRFDPAAAPGQQYLILLENLPRHGAYGTALFPASAGGAGNETVFEYSLRSVAADAQAAIVRMGAIQGAAPEPPPPTTHSWDFGAGRIYEYEPPVPDHVAPPLLRAADGRLLDITSAAAMPQVGDTVHGLQLEGIPRLGIATRSDNKAVIRHISDHLIIAEDVRLESTLVRENGSHNTPLSEAQMAAITAEYEAHALAQGDMLFDGMHNSDVSGAAVPRVLAVHSLMFADNIWGYTYSRGDYFAFDYWVLTDGSTPGLNQNPQRVADNLFMHEIAHMRHWGLLERNGYPARGNRWLVEGFARFSERLPIAERLLEQPLPSRTDNVRLPLNPAYDNRYFRDDVPTFLNAGTPFGGGYHHSSWIFDYFADMVALDGGDWLAALRDLVIAAGSPAALDAAVRTWLPDLSFAELLTRARVALYADDLGTADLPAWTQYHQYQLRLSRPAGSLEDEDPRNAWKKLAPGQAIDISGTIPAGGAVGYVVDGTQSLGRTLYMLATPPTGNVAVSITRIR
jgi:hypothetical protein